MFTLNKTQIVRIQHITHTPIHLTYRLYGSIPNLPLQKLHSSLCYKKLRLKQQLDQARQRKDREEIDRYRSALTHTEIDHYLQYDNLLDRPVGGPAYLVDERAKRIVIASWHHIAHQRGLHIYAISVMSNHVHVLLETVDEETQVNLPQILEDHKKYTATQLNRLHGTKGRRVWAEKEYCREVRRGTFEQVLWYVLSNPVKAGLTDEPLSWVGNWWNKEVYASFIATRVA